MLSELSEQKGSHAIYTPLGTRPRRILILGFWEVHRYEAVAGRHFSFLCTSEASRFSCSDSTMQADTVLRVPDGIGDSPDASHVGASRKRKVAESESHRSFFLLCDSGTDDTDERCSHGVYGVMSVSIAAVGASMVGSYPDCTDTDLADISSQFQLLGLSDSVCWRILRVRQGLRIDLPREAAHRWGGSVVVLRKDHKSVHDLHRAYQIILGAAYAWNVHASLLTGLLDGSRRWLATPVHHARLCGIPLPDGIATQVPMRQEQVQPFLKRKGWAAFRFSVPCIVNTLKLWWALRNSSETPIKQVLRWAWQISIPAEQRRQLEADLQDGTLRLPDRPLLQVATVKLDILWSVYQRVILSSSDGWRYLLADSSPIRKQNFFCVREDRFLWPKGKSHQEVLQLQLQTCYCSRHLQLTILGLGAAGLLQKSSNLIHVLRLEAGDWKQFTRLRSQVRGFCSDQGVEAGICDVAAALSDNCNMQEPQWRL